MRRVGCWRASRWAAAAMLVFTLAAAVLFHNFWAAAPDAAQNQMIHFMKNISMAGATIFCTSTGTGRPSSTSLRSATRASRR